MARYHSDNPSVFILATPPPFFLPFSHLFCYCLNLLACLHFLLTKQLVFNKGSEIVHCTIMCMRICMNIIRNEPTAYRIGLNQYRDDRQPYISLLFPVVALLFLRYIRAFWYIVNQHLRPLPQSQN